MSHANFGKLLGLTKRYKEAEKSHEPRECSHRKSLELDPNDAIACVSES